MTTLELQVATRVHIIKTTVAVGILAILTVAGALLPILTVAVVVVLVVVVLVVGVVLAAVLVVVAVLVVLAVRVVVAVVVVEMLLVVVVGESRLMKGDALHRAAGGASMLLTPPSHTPSSIEDSPGNLGF